ncbi:MAG: GDSL-type esterase/lipase family protein [Bacilli bacterium]|nr:GDSL-type esterase/lipase family protein [Bacilli bacterium]
MFLIQISTFLFIMMMVITAGLITTIIILVIYILKFIKKTGEDKRAIFRELNEQAHPDGIVFLGDSLTDFYHTDEFFYGADIYNRGIAGDTTDGVLDRLEDNVFKIKPRKIFLQIGTNDFLLKRTPQEIAGNIIKIIKEITDRKIMLYVLSLYPVHPRATVYSKVLVRPRTNPAIEEINAVIKAYCESHDIVYIDIYPHLLGEDGFLKKEYTVEGLHISLPGYMVITNLLTPFIP